MEYRYLSSHLCYVDCHVIRTPRLAFRASCGHDVGCMNLRVIHQAVDIGNSGICSDSEALPAQGQGLHVTPSDLVVAGLTSAFSSLRWKSDLSRRTDGDSRDGEGRDASCIRSLDDLQQQKLVRRQLWSTYRLDIGYANRVVRARFIVTLVRTVSLPRRSCKTGSSSECSRCP